MKRNYIKPLISSLMVDGEEVCIGTNPTELSGNESGWGEGAKERDSLDEEMDAAAAAMAAQQQNYSLW